MASRGVGKLLRCDLLSTPAADVTNSTIGLESRRSVGGNGRGLMNRSGEDGDIQKMFPCNNHPPRLGGRGHVYPPQSSSSKFLIEGARGYHPQGVTTGSVCRTGIWEGVSGLHQRYGHHDDREHRMGRSTKSPTRPSNRGTSRTRWIGHTDASTQSSRR